MHLKCIYCFEEKPKVLFSKTEHIIPQSFGMFESNFTLNGIVCDECNQYFGDNLEIGLARDTYEGISRFDFGLKKEKDFKTLGKKGSIIIKIAEGPLKGAYAFREYSKKQNKITLQPIPQVGFLKKNSEDYQYYLIDQLPKKEDLSVEDFDIDKPNFIRSFGCIMVWEI